MPSDWSFLPEALDQGGIGEGLYDQFKPDLEYSLSLRDNDIFDKFYYRVFPELEHIGFVDDLDIQKKGIDKLLYFKNGSVVTIDEKKRGGLWDILLELRSWAEMDTPGWLFTSQMRLYCLCNHAFS